MCGALNSYREPHEASQHDNILYVHVLHIGLINSSCFSGGAFPYTIGRIEHGFNCRPDICAVDNKVNPREYLGRIYADSLVHDAKALKLLVDVMGEVKAAILLR